MGLIGFFSGGVVSAITPLLLVRALGSGGTAWSIALGGMPCGDVRCPSPGWDHDGGLASGEGCPAGGKRNKQTRGLRIGLKAS